MLQSNYSLEKYNTFRVDVKSKLFVEIKSEKDLSTIFSDKNLIEEKKIILGGGSNTLFTKDFDGLVIKISISGVNVIEENIDNVILEAGSGVIWNDLVKYCVANSYWGIENLTLIPGTVGAAPIQNIGAYGQELADTFISLKGFSLDSFEQKEFTKEQCKFSYRSSIFKEKYKNEFIITSIRLKLSKNAKASLSYKSLQDYFLKSGNQNPTVNEISQAVATIRQSKLPDPDLVPNAGSFFKNPVVNNERFNQIKSDFSDIISFPSSGENTKISAGWLIEKCGWKGKRLGDVGTFPEHALVICNFGNASGAEILEFAMRIKEEVQAKFGIALEEEVNII